MSDNSNIPQPKGPAYPGAGKRFKRLLMLIGVMMLGVITLSIWLSPGPIKPEMSKAERDECLPIGETVEVLPDETLSRPLCFDERTWICWRKENDVPIYMRATYSTGSTETIQLPENDDGSLLDKLDGNSRYAIRKIQWRLDTKRTEWVNATIQLMASTEPIECTPSGDQFFRYTEAEAQ
jgi:hypothetical protein